MNSSGSKDITRLDNEHDIEYTFKVQNAKWHKSCHLKFCKSKLELVKERTRKFGEEQPQNEILLAAL